jgi:hypothetical protein
MLKINFVMKMKLSFGTVFYAFLFLFTISNALGQDNATPKKWNYLGDVYLMFPNMEGELGIGNLPEVTIDADPGNLLGQLKFGAMLYFEANNDDWAISSDLLYMKLQKGVEPHGPVAGGEATVEELAWELAGMKKVKPWLDLGIAARLVYLYAGLDLQTINNPKAASTNESWVDPVIVMRSQKYFNEKLFYQLRGDFGGFGIGSDFTWQAQANIGYRFSKLFQTSIGYRYLAIDYDNGTGKDRLLYDMDTYGVVVRLGFNF